MNKKIRCLAVASDFMTEVMKQTILDRFEKYLTAAGIEIQPDLDESGEVFLILGGGTENQIYSRYKHNQSSNYCHLIAHDENNSLPAALELLAALRNLGIKGRIYFLDSSDPKKCMKMLQELSEFYSIKKRLNETRIGAIGEPSDWLVASSPDKKIVKEVWGPEMVDIPMNELIDINDTDDVNKDVNRLQKRCNNIVEPDENDLVGAVKIYNRMNDLVKQYNVDALTVKCFDLLDKTGITGCYALSQLNDRRVLAGCEGDVISILTMQWLYYLTDSLPWMGNPSSVDVENNSLIIAHCTIHRDCRPGDPDSFQTG